MQVMGLEEQRAVYRSDQPALAPVWRQDRANNPPIARALPENTPMTVRAAHMILPSLLGLLMAGASAQTTAPARPLVPMSTTSIGAALARPIGQAVRAPRTSGAINLKGKRVYIAEYLLLFDQSGELATQTHDGRLLGQVSGTRLNDGPATLAYRSQPDIAALQALTDRGWADLQARLAAAGVVLADAGTVVREIGAVYPSTEPASRPGAPVLLDGKSGETTRRYLALAPTGMKLVQRTAAGIGLGNLSARLAYPTQDVEGLSLAMALNFSALEAGGQRVSGYSDAEGAAATAPASTLSPLMELAPAPAAALVHAHAQLALVNLDEALLLAGEFARLRAAPAPVPAAGAGADPLLPLLSLGRRLVSGPAAPRVDALLELDGPASARLMLYAIAAANQAIADALKAAR